MPEGKRCDDFEKFLSEQKELADRKHALIDDLLRQRAEAINVFDESLAKLRIYLSGRTFLIENQGLIGAFEEIASGEAFQYETARRDRRGSARAHRPRDFKARRITPRLETSCRDAADLLPQLVELAQAVSNDYDGVEARLSPGSTA